MNDELNFVINSLRDIIERNRSFSDRNPHLPNSLLKYNEGYVHGLEQALRVCLTVSSLMTRKEVSDA